MTEELHETLQINGITDLEIAEIRKELAAVNISLEDISCVERPTLSETTKFGDPATVILLLELGKIALPLVAGVLAGWLAKERAKKKIWDFEFKKGDLVIRAASSEEPVEKNNTEATLNNLLKLAKD